MKFRWWKHEKWHLPTWTDNIRREICFGHLSIFLPGEGLVYRNKGYIILDNKKISVANTNTSYIKIR